MRLLLRLRGAVHHRCRHPPPKCFSSGLKRSLTARRRLDGVEARPYLRADAPYPCAPLAHTPAAGGLGLTSDKVRSVDGGEPPLCPSLPSRKLVGASISPSAVRRQALTRAGKSPKQAKEQPLDAWTQHRSPRAADTAPRGPAEIAGSPQSSSNQAWARRAKKARAAPTPTPS